MTPEELQELLNGPGLAPPAGVDPDFSAQGRHTLGYAILILTCVLSTLSVLVRLASRLAMKTVRLEDLLMVCALGLFAGEVYLIYDAAISPGLGVHQWNIQLKNMSRHLYSSHLGAIFYGLIVMCLKIAILCDWLRLFVPMGQRSWLFWTFHFLIWANVIYYLSGTFIEIWRCHPREKIWNPVFEGGSCPIDIGANNFVSGLINIVSDVAILALPQWVIWRLQVTHAKRIGISLLFVIGLFACISAVIRLRYLVRLMLSLDVTYYTTYVALWGVAEMTVGFLILGIPSLPKVIKALPIPKSLALLLHSIKRSSDSGDSLEGGLPLSWRKPLSWRRPVTRKQRDQWEISDLDTYDLGTVTSENVDRSEIVTITTADAEEMREPHVERVK
ncbi:hypothetical protein GQ44DRAFT_829083 [Phaeosphaeriaceae sp. PMI808]|nr:hypothetical protein GQ44DRAFT_829083 [Phaeosphaeriaceae sp. PMI808]